MTQVEMAEALLEQFRVRAESEEDKWYYRARQAGDLAVLVSEAAFKRMDDWKRQNALYLFNRDNFLSTGTLVDD